MLREVPGRSFYIPALDGLRCLAFFGVFVTHALPRGDNARSHLPGILWALWRALYLSGAYGVTLFFCLSSFLITTLLLRERSASGSIDIRRFYGRRVLRIWPLYFLILCLGLGLEPALQGHPLDHMFALRLATFTTTFNLIPMSAHAPAADIVGILWSVSVEEQYYLVWPWILKLCRARELLWFVAVGFILAGTEARVIQAGQFQTTSDAWFGTFPQLDCFGYGAVAALVYEQVTGSARRKTRVRLESVAAPLLGVTAIAVALIELGNPISSWGPAEMETFRDAFQYSGIAALCALAVYACASLDPPFLRHRVLIEGGRISYGLYCFHALMLVAVAKALRNGSLAQDAYSFFGALVLTVVAASLSYRYFEAPFLRLKGRLETIHSVPDPEFAKDRAGS